MSFMTTIPGEMEVSAAALAAIGATVVAANAGAAAPLLGVVPPAPEPASVLLAAAFLTHGGMYQAMQEVGSVIHSMFVATMGTSAASYDASEAANGLTML